MDPTPFILKTAIISSSLVSCHVAYAKLTMYSSAPQGVPIQQWPERNESPESPHLPHEEQTLWITVDSGASGTVTNTSAQTTHVHSVTQPAWLRNELSEKLIVVSTEDVFGGRSFSETPSNPKLNGRLQTKPLVPRRSLERTRRNC